MICITDITRITLLFIDNSESGKGLKNPLFAVLWQKEADTGAAPKGFNYH